MKSKEQIQEYYNDTCKIVSAIEDGSADIVYSEYYRGYNERKSTLEWVLEADEK